MDDFFARIMELALGQGLWAALYVYLFFRMLNENKSREERVIQENREREERYQATIDTLSGSIEAGVVKLQETLDGLSNGEEPRS